MDFVRYITRVYYICIIIVHYYNMKNNYSKRLMDVIEYSREEAARLQNSYIGPEHLMLGIIRDGEGKARAGPARTKCRRMGYQKKDRTGN